MSLLLLHWKIPQNLAGMKGAFNAVINLNVTLPLSVISQTESVLSLVQSTPYETTLFSWKAKAALPAAQLK